MPIQIWFLKMFPSVSNVDIDLSFLCTYDLYGPVHNAFDAGSIHYEGKWEVVGPWKSRLFGPCEMAWWQKASAIWDPTKLRCLGPNPLPLAQVMDPAFIKSITHRAIKS